MKSIRYLLLLIMCAMFLPTFAQNCSQPTYCDRLCWSPTNAHPPTSNPSYTVPTHVIVHHSGESTVYPTGTNFYAVVRSIWDYHVNTNGWSDIGYNWLIDRNGILYEARGSGVLGAHFSCMNQNTMGVCLIGNFNLETPTTAALDKLRDLISWESSTRDFCVTDDTYHSNSQLTLFGASGHRDGNSSGASWSCSVGTACPGNNLYSQLGSIRSNVVNLSCYNECGPAPTLDCTNAVALTCNTTYSGPSSTAASNIDLFGCNTWTETGPERVHTITTTTTGTITATISNFTGDLDVYILGSCDPSDCLGTVYSSSAEYTNAPAGTYYIVIDADDGSGSAYDLLVNCPASVTEDIWVSNATVSSASIAPGLTVDLDANQNYTGTQLDADLPNFDLDYYLSTDCNLSSNDVLLGGDASGLGSDDPSNSESETVTIPSTTTSGSYYIIFAGDNDGELTESDETNNIVCVAITITAPIPEDITVSNATVSATSALAGTTIMVTADQNYSGAQLDTNLPNFDLDYYLSTDCNLSSNDVLLGSDISGIGSDDPFESESANLTIPNSTAGGNYYILFASDNDNELVESDETNNVVCIAITITVPVAEDITVSNASVSLSSTTAGSTVNVTADHNYSGAQLNASLPSFELGYYLSTDCNLSSNDVLLGTDGSNLGSDAPSETETATLTIPNGTTNGSYFILFSGDNVNALTESDETNNVACVAITIVTQTPDDITVSNASVSLSSTTAGSTVNVTADHNYSGAQLNASLPSFELGYYLSTDCNLSSNDVLLGTDGSNLGSDAPSETETAALTIPTGTTSGSYFILFSGDNVNALAESDETNNVACVAITISAPVLEDITVTNGTVSSTSLFPGDAIDLEIQQNYTGNQLALAVPDINIAYILSTDCNLSQNDVLLGSDISNLGSNNISEQESGSFIIPTTTLPGNYFIIFSGDSGDDLAESDENNNTLCIAISILDPGNASQDLVISNSQVTPSAFNASATISASTTLTYSGPINAAQLPDVKIGMYFSSDCQFNSGDVFLGEVLSNVGSDLTTQNESTQLSIPQFTTAGIHYVLFSADYDGAVNETDETNNLECVQVNVLQNFTGIKDLVNSNLIHIYPNPNSGQFKIDLSKIETAIDHVSIYNSVGKLIFDSTDAKNNILSVDIKDSPSGAYFIKVTTAHQAYFKKFVLE